MSSAVLNDLTPTLDSSKHVPYLTLPYLQGGQVVNTCPALRPYQFNPMRLAECNCVRLQETATNPWTALRPYINDREVVHSCKAEISAKAKN